MGKDLHKKSPDFGAFLWLNLKLCLVAGFLDFCLFSTKTSEGVNACSANNTFFIKIDAVDHRRGKREASFNANAIGYFSNGESGTFSTAAALDDNALEFLQTFLVTFDNFVGYGDGITCFKSGKVFYNHLIFNELN